MVRSTHGGVDACLGYNQYKENIARSDDANFVAIQRMMQLK